VLRKTLNIKFSFEDVIGAFVTYFIYFISLIMALNQIGLTTTMFTIIFVAIIVLLLVSVILSIKDFIPNFVSGLMIKQKNFIEEGDVIRIKNIEGKVISLDLLETKIENKHKDIIYIPNSILTKHEIINYKVNKKKSCTIPRTMQL
jgi:small-conductance mechanosensitive channel